MILVGAVAGGGDHVVRAVAVAACSLAIVPAGLRWLRVAQREHYLTGAATRFALRWWGSAAPVNLVVLVVALAGIVVGASRPAAAFATAAAVVIGPVGLAVRGRSAPMAWTRRARTLAAVWAVLQAAAVAGGVVAGVGPVVAATAALWAPLFVDAACALTAPVERHLGAAHVARATARLRRVAPRVVAITGSYGKTSTKGYVAHLVGGNRSVVASPASFNNRAGLARAVNEHLADGTEVFVAEMGTYGPGEIAALCAWVRPDVAVITAIGPVHLERFGSEDRIVSAKAEILEGASVVVLVVDDPRLAELADRAELAGGEGGGVTVWRVSGRDPGADVAVLEGPGGLSLSVRGDPVAGPVAVQGQPGNVAAAVAVALELGVAVDEVARRLATLPTAPHRLEAAVGTGGVHVLDDTYNANPAGSRAALGALTRAGDPDKRRVVVTPGMVELGPVQAEENAAFARAAADVATDLVVVGRTNRRALLQGWRGVAGAGAVVVVPTRQQATGWVRSHLGEGDAVLYENDLPDHYP